MSSLANYRSALLSAMGLSAVALSAHAGPLPPPLALIGGDAFTGTTTTWSVDGADPGVLVALAVGDGLGSGPCPPILGGTCLDATNATLVALRTADAQGRVDFDIVIPSALGDGVRLVFQAVEVTRVPDLSNPLDVVTTHLPRTCGEFPEPDPNNGWSLSTALICGPVPSTGICPDLSSLGNGPRAIFYRKTGIQPGSWGGVDVYPWCFEDTVEDRCCYASDIAIFAIGRPFTVHGQARTAARGADPSWACDLGLDLGALPRRVRRRLADLWTTTAHGEHASVASFARFQLHLLHLGAPADLVADATAAMADEVRHAREAFGIASAFAGAPVGPGPLDTTDADVGLDVRSVVLAAVREGCVAETIAAAQVAEAARRCADPQLAARLAATAADEQRHAELAWRFVRWAVAQHPELAEAVRAEVLAPVALRPAPVDPDAAHLAAWGHLPRHEADAVARQVHAEVIVPCAEALLHGICAAA